MVKRLKRDYSSKCTEGNTCAINFKTLERYFKLFYYLRNSMQTCQLSTISKVINKIKKSFLLSFKSNKVISLTFIARF